ncbi:hypothetical protein GCM10010377_48950 [Streptomyces viridiviolaceus]|nr:hypothetical protein GCM10010377_48950 [Streptomyces viridiviolaceus]
MSDVNMRRCTALGAGENRHVHGSLTLRHHTELNGLIVGSSGHRVRIARKGASIVNRAAEAVQEKFGARVGPIGESTLVVLAAAERSARR